MSDYLQDLLKEVKQKTERLDSPEELESGQDKGGAVSGLLSKPGLPSPPGVSSKPGLPFKATAPPLIAVLLNQRFTQTSILSRMHDSEFRLYIHLVERASSRDDQAITEPIEYTQRSAMVAAGIKSNRTAVKAMAALKEKKLVKWVRRSRKRGEKSQIVVNLPDDYTASDD